MNAGIPKQVDQHTIDETLLGETNLNKITATMIVRKTALPL